MAEWSRLANSTISDYFRGVEEGLGTKNRFFAMLKKMGNIIYGQQGTDLNWAVEYREIPLTTNNMEQAVVPSRQDYVKRCSITPIGYSQADQMTKREKLMNATGGSQLIDYFKEMAKRLERNSARQFQEEVYIDSSATGNSGRLSGLETMFATNGTINITSTTSASRAANAADVVGNPSDTYAGLSTILGNYAGAWSTGAGSVSDVWPAGKGQLSFDFFSPVVVCYNNTNFSATNTWANQCVQSVRYAVVHMQRYNTNNTSAVNKIFLDRDLYRLFLDKQDSKEHMYVQSNYSLRSMGFEDVIQQDGVEVSWEWGIPGAVGYGLNFDNVELYSWQDTLWDITGPTYSELNKSHYVIADFFGNLKFRTPSTFCKFINIAA